MPSLHFHHIVIIELLALARVVVHPVEYDMGMIIRLKPLFTDLETLPIPGFGLSTKPVSLVLMQEDLERCNTPASLALLTKLSYICQCCIWSDEQYSLTDWRTSSHFYNLSILSLALTLLFLHRSSGLFLDHPFDAVIVRLQVRTAEARVYPLLVIGSQFGYNVDSGLADIAHVLGSSPVMSPA